MFARTRSRDGLSIQEPNRAPCDSGSSNTSLHPLPCVFRAQHFLCLGVMLMVMALPAYGGESIQYEYDALGRLQKVTRDDGTNTVSIEYEYDAAGNRIERTINGGTPPPPPNSPPTANVDFVVAASATWLTYANLTANDSAPDGDALTITAVTQPSNGTVTIHSSSTVRIAPTWAGTTRQFSYTISDGNGGSDTGYVVYTVPPSGGGIVLSQPGNSESPEQDGTTEKGQSESEGGE